MRIAHMGSIRPDGPCGTLRRPRSRTPIRHALGRCRSVRSTRRCVRHQLPSLPPGIDSNLVFIQERAGHVRSEETAAFMMQLLADVEPHYTPRLEQHPSAAAAPVSCEIEKKELRIGLRV